MELDKMVMDIEQHVDIAAPMAAVFEETIREITEGMKYPDGKSMDMKLERQPGGRWFRDMGDNSGHLWGHVQSIKAPALLELYGQMCMSYPVSNHIEFKLSEVGGKTRLAFRHRAVGLIDEGHRTGMTQGWGQMLAHIKSETEK